MLYKNIFKNVIKANRSKKYLANRKLRNKKLLILYSFLIVGMFRLIKNKGIKKSIKIFMKNDLLFLIISSYIIIILFFGWIVPITSSVGLAFTPLLTIIAISQVYKSKNRKN